MSAQSIDSFNTTLALGRTRPPLTVESRAWYNPNLETRWNLLPGLIASLSMIQTLMLAALSVARERENGTFDQLLVTPFSPTEIMIGKAIPIILIGLMQSTIVLLVALFWFKIPLAGSLADALYRADPFHRCQRRPGAIDLGGLGKHAASHALHFHADHAADPAFGAWPRRCATCRNSCRSPRWSTRCALPSTWCSAFTWRASAWLWCVHDLIPLVIISAITLPLAAWLFRHRLL